MKKNYLLIVEDEAIIADDIRITVEQAGYGITGLVPSVNRALELIGKKIPDLVIIDIFLKGNLSGIDLAHSLNKKNIPFIFLSANCNTQTLSLARSTYPYGFIVKPFKEKDLLVSIDIALYHFQNKRKTTDLIQRATLQNDFNNPGDTFGGMIGQSEPMLELYDTIKQVAPVDTSVLILGESGTGKEAVASSIHKLSSRHNQPLVKINCTTLPTNLVESELFGHEKGSFTNAHETKIGKFEKANGGTIFLDEIGELSIEIQSKLLRVLQEREIERVGSNETIKVDVRIIAATNKDLETMIAAGTFRLDLYYRLNVFPVDVPPLRNRSGDIALLTKYFIEHYAHKANKPPPGIAGNALHELENYYWPGNVRELQNIIERTVLLNKEPVIEHVKIPGTTAMYASNISANAEIRTIPEAEKQYLLMVLQKCNNRVTGPGGAAELLSIPPSTLYSKMKKFGLSKHKY